MKILVILFVCAVKMLCSQYALTVYQTVDVYNRLWNIRPRGLTAIGSERK